jgi:prepilin-type processing-associated H-X9-DG protein
MDENLVGYLLKALDPEAEREVEGYLRTHPEARARLDLLRQALQPLAADADGQPAPPRDLRARTLARVAAHQCRNLPRAPLPPRSQVASGRRGWRRSDLLAAAAVLVSAGLFIPALASQVQYHSKRLECANNLRVFGTALTDYADRAPPLVRVQHRGTFPVIAELEEPCAVAGAVVPLLRQAGSLPAGANTRCPATGPRTSCTHTWDDLQKMDPQEINQYAPKWLDGYAYTLGHWDGNRVKVHGRQSGRVPVMADGPPPDFERLAGANSPNHRGKGQNVLYADGHVEFTPGRAHGGDDIYLNHDRKVEPGLHLGDAVLGGGGVRVSPPLPPPVPDPRPGNKP